MGAKQCLFCNCQAEVNDMYDGTDCVKVDCPNCGKFRVDVGFEVDYREQKSRGKTPHNYIISGLIREKNEHNLRPEIITEENFMSMLNDASIPKTLMQKINKVLLHFYRATTAFGEFILINTMPIAFHSNGIIPYSIGYAKDESEYRNMLKALRDLGYAKETPNPAGAGLILTYEGIQKAEQLLSTVGDSDKVFVAMQFNKGIEEAHEKAIQPACKECGYQSFLTKDIDHNNGITDEIIAQIKASKFVIADFTHNNNGVYFEAGYAQGRGLEVIRTCNKDWFEKNGVHFDIKHYNLILWDDYEDLHKKLVNRIQATIWK